jgi:hypothetical protein
MRYVVRTPNKVVFSSDDRQLSEQALLNTMNIYDEVTLLAVGENGHDQPTVVAHYQADTAYWEGAL